jgi:hypothetical protein
MDEELSDLPRRRSEAGGEFHVTVKAAAILLAIFLLLVLVTSLNDLRRHSAPTIGGRRVPAHLRCVEDDVIGFDFSGRLACIGRP